MKNFIQQNLAEIIVATFLAAFMIAGTLDSTAAEDDLQEYCEMVSLYKQDISLGWPDYKRIYDKECPGAIPQR